MNDYDFYLRHGSVGGGVWRGFLLTWKGLAGVAGLSSKPHLRWRPWVLDPALPNDPAAGSWGVWQWRFELALLDGASGLQGMPPADGRTPAQMRADLLGYMNVPSLELQDVTGTVYIAKLMAYSEQAIEPFDAARPNGGWLAQIELAEVTV